MCGVAGFVAAGSAAVAHERRAALEAAVHALHHRGPDGTEIYDSGPLILGHTRLSIIDLEHGRQPMANEDGSVMTAYNGEIWNYRSLRRDLERSGHRFATEADTEVLVHGYEEWGTGLLDRLDGMFAFAIWDARAEKLLLARDRLGKKPLYFTATDEGLTFGSDMRSVVLTSGRRPELAREHLAEFLFKRYVGAPRTLIAGVKKLQPGHFLVYDRSSVEQRRYWQVAPEAKTSPLAPAELRALLLDSVRRRLMSDVPLGVLLSGGVDSVAVLGLMKEAGAESVASFTIGFDDPRFDERGLARLAAERYGTEHHEVIVGASQFLEALPRLSWFRDEPIAEPSEIPLLLLAEHAGQHVKVVLTGDGGDELFGGYPKYRAEQALLAGGPLAAHAMRLVASGAARRRSHRRLGRAADTMTIGDRVLRWASWFRSFSPEELDRLLVSDLRPSAQALTQPLRTALEPYAQLDLGRQILLGDLLTWLPDNMLVRGDKVLMSASVEGRMPLLDRKVVERVSSVPARSRVNIRSSKALLRRAVGDLVPGPVLEGPKRGFAVPLAPFLFEDESRTLERLVLSDRSMERGLMVPDELRALVDGRGPYGTDRELKLFTVASLELWLRSNVDDPTTAPPVVAADDPRASTV